MAVARQMPQLQHFAFGLIFHGDRFDGLKCRLVGHARGHEVDGHGIWITLDVEQVDKPVSRPEKQRPDNAVCFGAILIDLDIGMDAGGVRPCVSQSRNNDADHDSHGKVRHHGDNGDEDDDEGVDARDFPHDRQRVPGKCADHHHEHDADEGRERNLFDQRCCKQDEHQKEQRRRNARQARAAARFHIDHRLADHGTAAHATKQAGCGVRHALRDAFLGSAAALAGDLTHQIEGQQALDQADRGEDDGIGGDDLKGFPGHRHHGDVEGRQTALDGGHVADARHVDAEGDDQPGDYGDACKWRGKGRCDLRHEPDDGHGQCDKRQHGRKCHAGEPLAIRACASGARHLELRQLGKENDDGEPVDEAEHDRMGHEADEFAEMENARKDLQDAHQNNGCEQIFNAVFGDQRHHDDGQGAGRAGNHAGPSTEYGGDQTDHEGGIKPHQRMHARDKRKGHRFRHQRQCHCETRQQFGFQH